jgi:secreted Zn-dependent insulinase-like peptidase
MNVIADMFQYFRPDNCIIMLKDKAFAGKTACKEEQYGTEYNIRSITEQEMTHWTSKAMNVAGSNDDQLAPLLALPTPNPFVATNFDLKCGSAAAPAAAEESAPAATALLFVGPDQLYRTDCLELSDAAPATEPSAVMATEEAAAEAHEQAAEAVSKPDDAANEGDEEEEEDFGPEEETADLEDGSYELIPQPNKALTVWFKQDNHWRIPKLNVLVTLETLEASNSALAVAHADLLASTLKEVLAEYSYYADCAGLHYDITLAKGGLELSFSGYNDKLSELAYKTADELQKLASSGPVSEDIYDRLKQTLLRKYKNYKYSQPYHIAMIGGLCCLEDLRWSDIEKYNALLHASVAEFRQFVVTFTRNLRVEILIHGNATAGEARTLAETFQSRLKCEPLALSQLPVRRVVDLKAGCDYVYTQKGVCFNAKEANSAAENIYIVGEIDCANPNGDGSSCSEKHKLSSTSSTENVVDKSDKLRQEALVTFVAHILSEQAFDQLRTKEQLGYIVHTAVKKVGNIAALHFIVQSSHKDPHYLDTRIEDFLQHFYSHTLDEKFAGEEFQTNVSAVIDLLTEKPKNLNEECNRYFQEIKTNTYLFTRKHLMATLVKDFTIADVKAFMARYLLPNENRKKLSSQLMSARAAQELGGKVKPEAGNNVVVIKDPALFKRTMPLLALEPAHV